MNFLPAHNMQAIMILSPGRPEVLTLVRRPLPDIRSNEVLIKVAAAGINRPDVLQRKGLYPPPPDASEIPGLEVSGTIVALGKEVSHWQIGDSVCALVTGGGYAEYCAAPALNCLSIPKGIDLVEAASLPETFFTVWSNVFDRGQLKAGDSLLVHGGASGIGVAAIQITSALGHRVFTTAGNQEKCMACEKLGAEKAINYRTEDFVAIIKSLTNQQGVNIILDMVAGDYIPKNIDILAQHGRLLIIAFLGGSKATIDFNQVLRRQLTITGSTLRSQSVEFKAQIADALKKKIWPLLEAKRIRPVIHTTFPLHEATKAHALMESNSHIGKIVLTV